MILSHVRLQVATLQKKFFLEFHCSKEIHLPLGHLSPHSQQNCILLMTVQGRNIGRLKLHFCISSLILPWQLLLLIFYIGLLYLSLSVPVSYKQFVKKQSMEQFLYCMLCFVLIIIIVMIFVSKVWILLFWRKTGSGSLISTTQSHQKMIRVSPFLELGGVHLPIVLKTGRSLSFGCTVQ